MSVSLRFVSNSEFSSYFLTLTAKAKEADMTATKEFERTRIRFFIDVFTGVTVVLSQGLYQRNDIRRMFIKSGNDK